MLDRLLKDIVTEQAATYISLANHGPQARHAGTNGVAEKDGRYLESVPASTSTSQTTGTGTAAATLPAGPFEPQRAFSLPRFMLLLSDRIAVRDPYTRSFLISWLIILNQVPDLNVVSYLPQFLGGLLEYLGDPSYEVRTQTEILLEVLLREVGSVREVQLELLRTRREAWEVEMEKRRRRASEAKTVTVTDRDDGDDDEGYHGSGGAAGEEEEEGDADDMSGKETPTARQRAGHATTGSAVAVNDESTGVNNDDDPGEAAEADEDNAGEWTPGQGVRVDYPAIVEILIRFVSVPGPSKSHVRDSRHLLTCWPLVEQTRRSRRPVCTGSASSCRSCPAS